MLGCNFQGVDTVAALNTLQQMRLTGVGASIHQIHTSLVDGHGVIADEDADVSDTGIFRHIAAVAVNTHVLHDVDIEHIAFEIFHNRTGGVSHGLEEQVVISCPDLFRFTGTVASIG